MGVGQWQASFLMPNYSIPGWIYAVPPSKNLRNENADTCQAIAFLCLHIFMILYINIVPKATNLVKGITSSKYRDQERATVTIVKEKVIVLQQFFLGNQALWYSLSFLRIRADLTVTILV